VTLWRSRTDESTWYQTICARCGRRRGWPSLRTVTRDEADRAGVSFEQYAIGTDGTCRCDLDPTVLESTPPGRRG
jgi:hypothetical protein